MLKKATHLEKSQVILYENVFLEVIDFPVFYFPFFIILILQFKEKQDCLPLHFLDQNVFGLSYEQPIFGKYHLNQILQLKQSLQRKKVCCLKITLDLNRKLGNLILKFCY